MIHASIRSAVILGGLAAWVPALGAPQQAAPAPGRARVATQAEARAERQEAWIGVWLRDVVDGGVQVVAVVPGSPAAIAELRSGDIILQANERPVLEEESLDRLLAVLRPGDTLQLHVMRDGKPVETVVQVAARQIRSPAPRPTIERPAPPAPPDPMRLFPSRRAELMGLQVTEVTPALRTHYGAPEDAGLLVVRSDPSRLAGQSGLKVGDVLVKLGGTRLASTSQLETALLRWNLVTPLSAEVVRGRAKETVELRANLETQAREEQDRADRRKAEREILAKRLRLELERLERRMEELRRELEELEDR